MDDLLSPLFLRWLLLAVVFAPLLFAAVLAACGSRSAVARRLAGLLAVLHLAATVFLCAAAVVMLHTHAADFAPTAFRPVCVPGDPGGEYKGEAAETHSTAWNLFLVGRADAKPTPAVQFFIGLDGLNVWLVLLASLLTYLAVLVSWKQTHQAGGYYAWVFVLQTAVTGAFASFDVLLFYVFFELTLIPSFFLIGGWGVGGGKRDAARKFFLYTLFGSLFTLVGLIGVVYTNPATPPAAADADPAAEPVRGPVSFNVNHLMAVVPARAKAWADRADRLKAAAAESSALADDARKKSTTAAVLASLDDAANRDGKRSAAAAADRDRHQSLQLWLFFALVAGFVVKVPLVPFHTWLPAAYSEAPPPVTMLLTGLLSKLGTLGMLRVVVPLCPDAAVQYGLPVFGTLGAVGVVYAACVAFAQKDAKLMAAYSSVSHLGLLVLGLFTLTPEGVSGAALHMVNHGLTAGVTFALLGVLHDRYRTTDMHRLGGVWNAMPRFTFFVFVFALASVGLPGLNNFVSEMLLLAGLFTPWAAGYTGPGLAVAGAAGIFLSAWYTFTFLKRVFFGPPKEPHAADAVPPRDLSAREVWAFGLPAACCLALGLFPQPVLDTMKYDAAVIVNHTQKARERVNPTLARGEGHKADAEKPKH